MQLEIDSNLLGVPSTSTGRRSGEDQKGDNSGFSPTFEMIFTEDDFVEMERADVFNSQFFENDNGETGNKMNL